MADRCGAGMDLPQDQYSQLAETFRLLGEPNRLMIVVACLEQPLNVGTLAERTALSQSLVSHHLRLLRAARLLKAARQGRQVFYAIADGHVRDMLTAMIEHMTEPHDEEDAEGKPLHDHED
ncbi:Transcriptional regulator, ArsR family [Granulibacter bethesdensis]|uniref:Transcriptional regulator, ArsR family n=2 Tax=Granulibacter bethesdensis TaxID=364410 RepID=A0AAN0RC83_9PROT|nr:Transcriptional regulator, ArsR family [Granulibacter bethesdensis]AHJ64766.1 Transcriptional regulator, ArsR family [Granulibacter bethesdensis CGDNIH4]APH58681.1 Transcriptional regulator, ArsR family [Granulibacter bethesdensis]